MQARVTGMAGEHDAALKRAQELHAESRTLEAQHQELKVQLATAKTEYESRLQVAHMELESKQKQYEREVEFAQGQRAEVDRLRGELKDARDELKSQKAELDALRAQTPLVHTVAQYQTMPPGQSFGSPMQTGTMPHGHYSPTVVPYAGAANLTASPAQVSTLAGFSYHETPAPGPTGPRVPAATGPSGFPEATHLCASGNPTGSAPTNTEPAQGSYGVLGWPDRVNTQTSS